MGEGALPQNASEPIVSDWKRQVNLKRTRIGIEAKNVALFGSMEGWDSGGPVRPGAMAIPVLAGRFGLVRLI